MDVEQPDRHRPGAGAPPAHWPAKTRQLVDEIRLLCRDWLSEPLKVCLGDFDRALHEHAARTRSHIEQQRYQATRQRLVSERQAFEQRFVDCIDQALLQLGAPTAAAKAQPARLTLSLLDPLEHEMTGALDQLVARSAARGGPLLVELSYRLAVLVGAPPLESESMPLGPQAMAKAFRDSSAALGLPAEHHLLLLQAVEGRLIQGLTPLHEVINHHLAAAGILPRLRPFPLPRGPRPPRRQHPLPAAPAAETAASPGRSGGLHELLARQRGPRPVSGHARFASADEVQAALLALQRQLGRPAGAASLRHIQRLREALVDQLNAGQPIDAVPLLPSPDADDALELMARLFDALRRQSPSSSSAQALLDRVQLPMFAAAAIDGSFFDNAEQPARRLLDLLLEAVRDWLDGGDGGLVLEPLLARLDSEPPAATLHSELRAELERQLAPLQRKAQVTERHHVEAMQGRERLDQARQRANELLAGLLAKAPPRAALRALLEHAWSDVLALTLLRHGEQSETFARRLVITDQLLGRLPPGNLETLQAEIVAGLQQIGMHGEEATQVAQRLIGAGAMLQESDAPGLTGLAMRLKQRRSADEPDVTAQATPAVPSAEALRLHQRLSQHAGGWFEFAEGGGRVRRKLAWYSPRAARGLFVTRQGQRAEEMSLAELAQAIGAGKVRELPAANETDLDRALRSLADSLRQANPMPGARS